MMFGFGWLMMFVVIGLPILLIVLLLAAAAGFLPNLRRSGSVMQNHSSVYQPVVNSSLSATTATRYCSHCGAGLQSEWTHCPQCGAPIQ
jgi:ABC-type uncharacterized transport system YnjBCD permease subunit